MDLDLKCFLSDIDIARDLKHGISFGRKFVFIEQGKVGGSEKVLEEIDHQGNSKGLLTIPSSRWKHTFLPGIGIRQNDELNLSLSGISTDRKLYRYQEDIVHIFIVDLAKPDSDVEVVIRCNELELETRTVKLNSDGVGISHIFSPQIGDFSVEILRDGEVSDECRFDVVEYDLAPVSVTVDRLKWMGKKVLVQLSVRYFGEQFSGKISVGLYHSERRIDVRRTDCKNGLAFVKLEFESEFTHQLEVRIIGDDQSIARVELAGSSKTERSWTTLSDCHDHLESSMIPLSGSVCSRGLFINKESSTQSPVTVSAIHENTVHVHVNQEIDDLCLVTEPLHSGIDHKLTKESEKVIRVETAKPGQIIEIPVCRPLGILWLAGFVHRQPWENVSVTVSQSEMSCELRIESLETRSDEGKTESKTVFQPGEKINITVEANKPFSGSCILIVRDSRVLGGKDLQSILAGKIKESAELLQAGRSIVKKGFPTELVNMTTLYCPVVKRKTVDRLLDKEIISDELHQQLVLLARKEPGRLYFYLVDNQIVDPLVLCRLMAEEEGWDFARIENDELVDERILELCPEAVAREREVLPFRVSEDGTLFFLSSNTDEFEHLEILRFILNRNVELIPIPRYVLLNLISLNYGNYTELSADSILQEFTDTGIDFTETVSELFEGGPVNLTGVDSLQIESKKKEDPPLDLVRQESSLLFCDLLPLKNGQAFAELQLPDIPGEFVVESFTISGTEWTRNTHELQLKADPFIKLVLPNCLFDSDQGIGRLKARCSSERMSIELLRDGIPVPIYNSKSLDKLANIDEVDQYESEYWFQYSVGNYSAKVADLEIGRINSASKTIAPLGKFSQPREIIRILQKHDSVDVGGDITSIALLPSFKETELRMVLATSDYSHLCCEQTSAKIFSNFRILDLAMRSSEDESNRSIDLAIESIRIGLKRQKSMWIPEVGFRTYPHQNHSPYWGHRATENLLKISLFSGDWIKEPRIQEVYSEVQELAEFAAQAYRIQWPPMRPSSMWEAYAIACNNNGNSREAVMFADHRLKKDSCDLSACDRHDRCLAAAILLKAGSLSQIVSALKIAGQMLSKLTSEGRFYSTIESVGGMFLLQELGQKKWAGDSARFLVNGKECSLAEVKTESLEIESLSSLTDSLPVKLSTITESDWTEDFESVPVEVSFWNGNKQVSKLQVGDRVEMKVSINCDGSDSYKMGDFFWIALPPCLSWLKSGGLVKQFSFDLEGENSSKIPIVATEATKGPGNQTSAQHFCVCLRNMYDENRLGSPGPIPVEVSEKS